MQEGPETEDMQRGGHEGQSQADGLPQERHIVVMVQETPERG